MLLQLSTSKARSNLVGDTGPPIPPMYRRSRLFQSCLSTVCDVFLFSHQPPASADLITLWTYDYDPNTGLTWSSLMLCFLMFDIRCYKVDCLAFFLIFFLIFLIHPEPFYPFATYLSHLRHHRNRVPFILTFHKLLPLFTPILLHISRYNLVTTKFKQF